MTGTAKVYIVSKNKTLRERLLKKIKKIVPKNVDVDIGEEYEVSLEDMFDMEEEFVGF